MFVTSVQGPSLGGRGGWRGLLLAAGLVWAGAAQAVLYRCPGNLFTNELEPAQARAQGCVPAALAGWSQAQRARSEPLAATAAALPPSANPATPSAPLLANPSATPLPVAAAGTGAALPPSPPPLPAPGPGEPVRVAFSPAQAPRPDGAAAQRVAPALQQARDRDASAVLQAELARTLAEQQALGATPADSLARQRLHADEQALRRELARLGR